MTNQTEKNILEIRRQSSRGQNKRRGSLAECVALSPLWASVLSSKVVLVSHRGVTYTTEWTQQMRQFKAFSPSDRLVVKHLPAHN